MTFRAVMAEPWNNAAFDRESFTVSNRRNLGLSSCR
jgi:hypothetical protein